MNDKMPHTPFSTGLSRSAKETEIRIRNIFSGPKKRPPVLFLALMCLIALSCGDLVSCQVKEAEAPDAGGSSSLRPPVPSSAVKGTSWWSVTMTLMP